MKEEMRDSDIVFHFSANADVRNGIKNTAKDLQQNTIATYNVLESMRVNGIKNIVFTSTGSIYGNHSHIPTKEDDSFPIQTSLYGASKLACEGLIEAYCEAFDMQCWIFRLTSILGERYTHGFCYDFYHQLKKNPHELNVLGNGTAVKSYLYISDFVDGVMTAFYKSNSNINIFNLGSTEHITVRKATKIVTDCMKIKPQINFGEEDVGWIGDNKTTVLNIDKMLNLRWIPGMSIEGAIERTINDLEREGITNEHSNN